MKFLVIAPAFSYNQIHEVYIQAKSIIGFGQSAQNENWTMLYCGTDIWTLRCTIQHLKEILKDPVNYVEFPELG